MALHMERLSKGRREQVVSKAASCQNVPLKRTGRKRRADLNAARLGRIAICRGDHLRGGECR
jgi:hypothetical protein